MNMLNEDVLKEMMAERARQARARQLRSAKTRRHRERVRPPSLRPEPAAGSSSYPGYSKAALVLVMVAGVAAGVANVVHGAPGYAPNLGPSWLALTGGIVATVTLSVAPIVRIRLIGLVAASVLLLPTGGILLIVHGLSVSGVIPSPVDPVSVGISAGAASCLIGMWAAPQRRTSRDDGPERA